MASAMIQVRAPSKIGKIFMYDVFAYSKFTLILMSHVQKIHLLKVKVIQSADNLGLKILFSTFILSEKQVGPPVGGLRAVF